MKARIRFQNAVKRVI